MMRETITLTQREHQRVHVMSRLVDGILRPREAAQLLGLSPRHLRRLRRRLQQHGPAALAHGNRGRPSPRRLAAAIRARVLSLARTVYAGVNDHQLTELLADREGVRVSRKTVQRLLRAAGFGSPRTRRPPRHRRRRERMPQAGLLVQMDGSHHPWLEDRGPRLVLLAAIDDATGEVLAAVFRPEEDAHGYFLLLRRLISRYGVPTAAYTDRHGLFHRDPRTPQTLAEELDGVVPSTQIGRALHELGIRWIPASSPQGKGRVERLFGTFQDRLVTELRLAQARTLEAAQRVCDRFLPRYNARFAHPPTHPEPAWQSPPADLERICCFKYQRTVGHDNTIQLDGRLLQLLPGPGGRSYATARVDIHAHLNGTLAVYYRGQRLSAKRLPHGHRPTRQGRPATASRPRPKGHIPPVDHPWRRGADARARCKYLKPQGETFS
ncbi:MAG TPA: ISNCY family transposase [Methylomirabilota bacterium]|nr:ISNCY family transposase [Methylomirabilota bacterium]